MREIKFRAWDKQGKQWLRQSMMVFDYNGDLRSVGAPEPVDNTYGLAQQYAVPLEVELMQYTGLEDKNGVEIYEGDIVQPLGDTLKHLVSKEPREVYWWRNGWQMGVFNPEGVTAGMSLGGELEVIGNIYENPELAGVQP